MIQAKNISIVIPCYNEEKTISKVLEKIPNFVDEIIVVDNNSTDGTPEAVRKFKNVFLEKEFIRGYGAAIKKGIIKSQGDIVIIMDGDGQHSIEDAQRLTTFLIKRELDLVWGSRFPATTREIPLSRIFGNKIQTLLFNLLFRTRIRDSQSGMMVFKKNKLFKRIDIRGLSNEMSFSEEIKARVIFAKLRWEEKKISIKKRKGASKLNPILDGVKNVSKLFQLYYEIKRRR